ncbi:MAG: acylphosphatase [Gammaproteobacteria bacterium]|nr:acylphosphatase [Gammaproteobacteria bacterium]
MTTTGTPLVAVTGCVRGRVQGVGFRYSMQRTADGLGVAGWVRNLPDRSVAFHAEGSRNAVDALLSWSQSGPAFARVDEVDVQPCDVRHLESFEVLP